MSALSISRAVLVAALAATRLGAQQADTTKLPPTVVTATRLPVSATSSPATVSVVTGEELRLRGVTSLADALQSLPGMTFAQSGSFGGTTALFLRGGESKYVKVLIDGVPANDPGGAMDFGSLTTDNVERIEIVRGPASVLYGADAVTGVIQIFTRRGRDAPKTILSVRGGTYGSRDADATVLGAIGSGDYSFALARHDTRGIYAFNNAYHNTVASGAMHFLLDPSTDLRLSLRYGDDVYHYPTNSGGEVVDTNAQNTLDRTTLAVELGHYFTPRLDAHLSVTSSATSGGTDDQPDTPAASGFESLDHTRRRGADVRANAELPAATVLSVGAQTEQEDQRTESQSVFGTFQSTSVFHASRHNAGVYAQTLSTLPDSIVVTAGARLDENERFGRFGTYRLAGSWPAFRGMHVRGSVGTAFREPTFFENYATGYVTGNPGLSPERSAVWDVGVRQALLGDRLTLGVTQFEQRFRNMIDYTGSTTACGASYCNVARASANGREFEASFAATARLVVDANLTHLETKVLDPGFDTTSGGLYRRNEPLIRRPTTSWNSGVAYHGAAGGLDVRMMHVGARSDRDFRPYPATPVVVPAYTRTDIGGSLALGAFIRDATGVDLTLRVENLFDVKYQSVFNFLTPRRMVLIGARVTF